MLKKVSVLENFIIREIAEHRYLPGKKIPSRNALALKFNCSRTTVESAVENLTRYGYLGSRKGSGTYVTSANPCSKIRHASFVCAYDIFSSEIKSADMLFRRTETKIPVDFLHSSLCEEKFESLARPGNAVIWMTPEPELIYFMRQLKKRGIPQFLINREYLDFDSICTDQEGSLRKGMMWLLMESGKEIAVVSPTAGFERPYLFERISSFFKCALETGASLPGDRIFLREFKDAARDSAEIGAHLFDTQHRPKGICILAHQLVVPILTCARSRGLEPGRDFFLLMFDWTPEFAGTRGIAMMRQPFDVFLSEARNWLLDDPYTAQPRHLRCSTELILPS